MQSRRSQIMIANGIGSTTNYRSSGLFDVSAGIALASTEV